MHTVSLATARLVRAERCLRGTAPPKIQIWPGGTSPPVAAIILRLFWFPNPRSAETSSAGANGRHSDAFYSPATGGLAPPERSLETRTLLIPTTPSPPPGLSGRSDVCDAPGRRKSKYGQGGENPPVAIGVLFSPSCFQKSLKGGKL
ncbi:MAG: hypothetical protein ACR2FY_22030, partial [Pirellulaceae bacterium]